MDTPGDVKIAGEIVAQAARTPGILRLIGAARRCLREPWGRFILSIPAGFATATSDSTAPDCFARH
jgi:hypothetical protein